MVKKILYIIVILFFGISTKAQDIHFSQFYYSPLTLNPANTGHFDGDWRLSNIFRTQWGSISKPYNTIAVGFDKQINIYSQKFGAGIYFLNDKSGSADLTANKIMISLAYHTKIEKFKVHYGLQLGYVNKKYGTDITFPSQFDWDIGKFNGELPNNETNLKQNISYFDVNAGVVASRKIGKIEPEFGYSLFHITNPKEQFSTYKNKLPLRHIFHLGAQMELNKMFFVIPRILYMNHKRAADMVLGGNFGYYLPKNNYSAKSIFFGPHVRTVLNQTDAVIVAFGLNFTNMDIGISYDVNVSSLSPATSHRGALEFSLIYRTKNTNPKKITFPCDRY